MGKNVETVWFCSLVWHMVHIALQTVCLCVNTDKSYSCHIWTNPPGWMCICRSMYSVCFVCPLYEMAVFPLSCIIMNNDNLVISTYNMLPHSLFLYSEFSCISILVCVVAMAASTYSVLVFEFAVCSGVIFGKLVSNVANN